LKKTHLNKNKRKRKRSRRRGKKTEEKGRAGASFSTAWNSYTAVWSRRPWATTPPPASTTAPPAKQSDQQDTASSAPGKLFFPLIYFVACVSSCMHNICSACKRMGGNNSPCWFLLLLGQVGSGPALWVSFSGQGWFWPSPDVLWARLILAQPCCLGRVWPGTKKERELLGRDRPNPFGAESGPVSWASPAQPT